MSSVDHVDDTTHPPQVSLTGGPEPWAKENVVEQIHDIIEGAQHHCERLWSLKNQSTHCRDPGMGESAVVSCKFGNVVEAWLVQ